MEMSVNWQGKKDRQNLTLLILNSLLGRKGKNELVVRGSDAWGMSGGICREITFQK